MAGYDTMLHMLGGNLVEFIENLDSLHSYLALSYQEMNAPSFHVEKRDDGRMLLHYYSDWKSLYHIVPGIVSAVAKGLFDTEGKKEHVVFLISQSIRGLKRDFCHERGINELWKETLERVGARCTLPCWEKITLGTANLRMSFTPCYPEKLWIEEQAFCNAFPFHIVFGKDLKVKQTGVNIQKFVPGLQTMDIRLDKYFSIVHRQVTFNIERIRMFINSQFVPKTRREMVPLASQYQSMLKLRGQMVWMETLGCMMYLCYPKLRSLQELEEKGLHISDMARHDTNQDLILLNQQRLAEIELSTQLEHKKEELGILSLHLEAERKKTETLLYAMLPRHVANQLKEGKKVEAGEFQVCTILFSDVVTFTNIQNVNMLNSMYSKFDCLTSVHDVYKVETIGDAYMVVGGVPIPADSHAERVANFALGMHIAARKVSNPVTGQRIQEDMRSWPTPPEYQAQKICCCSCPKY
ncbi:LOW QUALITY PROTEIN: guanylate cyclase soluble subunit beta-2 [Esox lucius]|uniref:LOW QUALITY PROTEIN: guanylate cyclase soluble subunit beta-2 n=1 Tax=Esox lucius TaxID=8010 RepID=UPI001477477C|nr:LOW QUALITY PROTEIN: guanylate cyclase soluble subunit beta-2 [Esox lucius]